MNRKSFIKTAALASAATLSHPFITYAKKSKYRLALIGSGWWGTNILREAIKHGEVQVIALCDVDENQLKKCQSEVHNLSSDRPKLYTDYQDLLHKEKPEIVINATPDHWHALIAIAALKAGAHLYLEKPIGHTINEGKAILRTLNETQATCAVGFHRRYSPHNVSGMEFLKSGKVGTIKEVRAFVNYNFSPSVKKENEQIPSSLNWDKWCGPAPLVPYSAEIHPIGWRQHTAFANGQLGDWGPHWFDQILWWSEEIAPKKVFSVTSPNIKDSHLNAPESQMVVYNFESFNCFWEHSNLNGRPESKSENVGIYFHGTEGTFHMGWQKGWTFYPRNSKSEIFHEPAQLGQPNDQNIALVWADFMNAIKSKKQPFADLLKGHRATNMSLMGMAALKMGRSLEWDAQKEVFINDSGANKQLSREYRKGYEYPM